MDRECRDQRRGLVSFEPDYFVATAEFARQVGDAALLDRAHLQTSRTAFTSENTFVIVALIDTLGGSIGLLPFSNTSPASIQFLLSSYSVHQ